MSHAHKWTPVQGRRGRYTCACGAHGWRSASGIRVARTTKYLPELPSEISALPRLGGDGGRVEAMPLLDDIERNQR